MQTGNKVSHPIVEAMNNKMEQHSNISKNDIASNLKIFPVLLHVCSVIYEY